MRAPERSSFVCELGHALWKYFIGDGAAHDLLCPICDRAQIRELEERT